MFVIPLSKHFGFLKLFLGFICKSSTDCSGSVALKLNDGLVHEYENKNSLQRLGGHFDCLVSAISKQAKITETAS